MHLIYLHIYLIRLLWYWLLGACTSQLCTRRLEYSSTSIYLSMTWVLVGRLNWVGVTYRLHTFTKRSHLCPRNVSSKIRCPEIFSSILCPQEHFCMSSSLSTRNIVSIEYRWTQFIYGGRMKLSTLTTLNLADRSFLSNNNISKIPFIIHHIVDRLKRICDPSWFELHVVVDVSHVQHINVIYNV